MTRPKELYLCEKCQIMVLVLRGGAAPCPAVVSR